MLPHTKKGWCITLSTTEHERWFLPSPLRDKPGNKLDDISKNYAEDASSHVLAGAKTLDFDTLIEELRDASFDSSAFYNSLIKKYPKMVEFDGNNPERHVSYWDFENLVDVMDKVGFEATIPTYQCSSVARPFCNLHVFDTTEPRISFYADIIK